MPETSIKQLRELLAQAETIKESADRLMVELTTQLDKSLAAHSDKNRVRADGRRKART